MLSNLNRKKQIYDRRPEDHPMYADEWTKFWEMRYREVQESGDDPETHDYKADWIPFWGKRVDSIFEEELTSKTRDLLSQFGLSNTDEPKREDFPSKEGGRAMNPTSGFPPAGNDNAEDPFADFVDDYQRFRSERGTVLQDLHYSQR